MAHPDNTAAKAVVLTLLLPLLATTALQAQPALSDGQTNERQAKVMDAYKDTNTYLAKIHYEIRETRGRWEFIKRSTFRIAFDRRQHRLMLDLPDLFLIVDGPKLHLRIERFKERHLVIDTPQPFSHAALISILPPDLLPELPSLRLLLGEQIGAAEPDMQVFARRPNPNDAHRRERLEIRGKRYSALLGLAPATFLVTAVDMRWKRGATRRPPDFLVQSVHQIDVEHHNTELPAGTFEFDATESQPVTTLAELAGRHRLEGKPAPWFELIGLDNQPFNLGNVKARVIMLNFWATWYPGRHQELRSLQRIQTWADRNSLSVAVITINIKDPPDKVRAEVQKNNLKLPVLFATDNAVVKAYDADELPHTVLIVDGRVAKVLDTVETKEAAIQNGINRLLAQAPTTQPPISEAPKR